MHEREGGREGGGGRETETEREREGGERETERDRERPRETERQRETERDRETERGVTHAMSHLCGGACQLTRKKEACRNFTSLTEKASINLLNLSRSH